MYCMYGQVVMEQPTSYMYIHSYTNHNLVFVFASSSFNINPFGPDLLPSSVPSKSPSAEAGHAHSSRSSGSRVPSSASTILSPNTGKNLYPWPLPPVARKRLGWSGW